MSVIFLVVPLALVLVLAALLAFVWAARRGQFDDVHTPAIRALHEDPPRATPDAPGQPRGGSAGSAST